MINTNEWSGLSGSSDDNFDDIDDDGYVDDHEYDNEPWGEDQED